MDWAANYNALMEDMKMKCSKCGSFCSANYFMMPTGKVHCQTCHNNLLAASIEPVKKPTPTGSKGEVTRLPKANSPMFTEQWSVVGSAKLPYIVSRKTHKDGSTTDEKFCCSCMAFTRNTPREDCKHILKVKIFEGMSLTAEKSGVAPVHAKEYAEFLKMKSAKDNAAKAMSTGMMVMEGDDMGRKFR